MQVSQEDILDALEAGAKAAGLAEWRASVYRDTTAGAVYMSVSSTTPGPWAFWPSVCEALGIEGDPRLISDVIEGLHTEQIVVLQCG